LNRHEDPARGREPGTDPGPGPSPDQSARPGREAGGRGSDDDIPSGLKKFLGPNWRETAQYLDAAYTMTGAVLGLALGGWALDRWFGTRPVLLLVGLGLGLVVGFYRLGRVMFWKR